MSQETTYRHSSHPDKPGTGGKKRSTRRHRVLRRMRLNVAVFAALLILSAMGMGLVRWALLESAQYTGTALSRSYAAEELSNLTVYETLLSFGAVSVEQMLEEGSGAQRLSAWMEIYVQHLETVLGSGVVDPYLVLEGGVVVAANPWEGDADYDVRSTPWYQSALEGDGAVIFTNVYTDAIYNRPVITAAQLCGGSGAVLAFDVFPENLRFRLEAPGLSRTGSFFLCDSQGTLIYKQTAMEWSNEEVQRYLDELIVRIDAGELGDSDATVTDLDGVERTVYYTRMDNGWLSIITVPYREVLEGFEQVTAAFALLIAAFLLVLVVLTWRDAKVSARMERTNETVRVLGNSYYALYRVDYGQGSYEMIKGSDYVRARLPHTGEYRALLETMGEVIEPAAYGEFAESFSPENIRRLVARRVRDFGGDFRRRFGEAYRWVNVRILFDESLAPDEVVLCFREVEDEKQRQLQEHKLLQDTLEVARKNEAAKQTFFSSMSHDMRTPLNAIIGLSELAGQNARGMPRVQEYLDKIRVSSRQLLGLINDILDMSRMEQGQVTLNNSRLDLRACVEECAEPFRVQAQTEGKTLELSFDLRQVWVEADGFRIQQILNNLLSNAFKFTERGDRVALEVRQMDQGEYAKYQFVVADTGIGMTAEFLPHLFEPYSRELRFSAKRAAGTGLGMPITKNLVVQMNGEITVDSRPGEGSSFTVVLPFARAEREEGPQPAKPAAEAVSLEGRHVLLAEDNEINMELATEILSMNGVKVTQAWNGREAVEQFQASEPFAFDAILMDMQMPEMDGCEAARRIRAMHRPDAGQVPILAVTANAFAEDIAATTAAGMNAHISKPIDFALLCRTLSSLMDKH